MQLFSADTTIFKKKIFFALEIMKKPPSNLAHRICQNLPELFFSTGPVAQTAPKTEIPYHLKPLNAGLGI